MTPPAVEPRSVRSSSLPLALTCPASQVPPRLPIASQTPEARLGSAVHELLSGVVRGKRHDDEDLDAAAARWRVEPASVAPHYWNGRRAWEQLADYFPGPTVEEEFSGTDQGEKVR